MNNHDRKLKVFLCHASEDKPVVRELFERLKTDGFDPWLDSEALLPGQDWDLEIQKAMHASEAVIVCFSDISVVKEGFVQKEIKYAQEIQKEKPEGTIFFIPLQLEECEMPFGLRSVHWGHYYEPDGYKKLVGALNTRAGQVKAAQGIVKSKRKPAAKGVLKKISTVRGGAESTVVGGNVDHSILGHTVTVIQTGLASWHRPSAPRPSKPMIGRHDEFDSVARLIREGKTTAITATVQGTPGVGKTLLAEHLAARLDGEFPGGVIFERLGVGFRDPVLANPILKKWVGFAEEQKENVQPTSDEIRSLLTRHGALLAILDDVWDLKAIEPLINALPNEACLLVTTRSRRIAQELHGEIYPLDVLNDDDALNLLKNRASPTDKEVPLLTRLAKALGNHAQALDIAAGSLARLPRERWIASVKEMERQVREGSGFGELHLPGDEATESRVEAALSVSYNDLKAEIKTRFRRLGAFAPDGSFPTNAAAEVWSCSSEEAEDQLTVFVELGLLSRQDDKNSRSRWQQHTLLRAYALALLRKEGEEDATRNLHVQAYNELMRDADDRQIYFLMLPDYPQLRHAFDWAIGNDIDLAQQVAGNTANLQAAFYLVKENFDWACRLVEAARDGDEEVRGRAIGMLANALSRLSNLPDEDRRARLLEALAAYDEALQHYRPDTAPLAYAMTQTNLANLHMNMADLPEENKRERQKMALQGAVIAISIFSSVGHAPYTQHVARQLRWMGEQMGPAFPELWQELNLGELPEWLK